MTTLEEMMRDERGEAKKLLQGELDDPTVHSVRKLIKRLRAQLRLLQASSPSRFRKIDAALGDTSRSLGALRERAIARTTFVQLLAEQGVASDAPEVAPLLQHFEAEQDQRNEIQLAAQQYLQAAENTLNKSLTRARKSHLVLGYHRTYQKARKRFLHAKKHLDHPERLHAFRKQVKHHLNQLRSLPEASRFGEREAGLDELGEVLGSHHDLADLERRLREVSEQTGLSIPEWLYVALEQKSESFANRAALLGDALFSEPASQATAAHLSRNDARALLGQPVALPSSVESTVAALPSSIESSEESQVSVAEA